MNDICGECDDEHEATSDTDDMTRVKARQHENDMIHADKHSKYDPVQRMEDAYIKLIDIHNLNTNSLTADIDETKSEIRKIPNKLHDNMKKDLQANTKALQELCAKIDQNDELKKQISCLTAQLKTSIN